MLGEECNDPKCKMDDVDDDNEVIYDINDLRKYRKAATCWMLPTEVSKGNLANLKDVATSWLLKVPMPAYDEEAPWHPPRYRYIQQLHQDIATLVTNLTIFYSAFDEDALESETIMIPTLEIKKYQEVKGMVAAFF